MASVREIRVPSDIELLSAIGKPDLNNMTERLVSKDDVSKAVKMLKEGKDVVVEFKKSFRVPIQREVESFCMQVNAGVKFELKFVWNDKKNSLFIIRLSVNDAG